MGLNAMHEQAGEDFLDEGVLAKLPPNCRVLSTINGGQTAKSASRVITIQLEDGSTKRYFKKQDKGDVGGAKLHGRFESDSALHAFLPNGVPKPVALGTYANDPDTHFYLSEFVHLEPTNCPKSEDWSLATLKLHVATIGKSPTGQFGFHVPTHLSHVPVNNAWNSSWEAFWAQQMKSLFDAEEDHNGPDETLAELRSVYFNEAIPRYLRPLESDGKSITPCLIHANLWPGNIQYKTGTDELYMYDSCGFWGHNEADLAVCYNPRYKVTLVAAQKYKEWYEGLVRRRGLSGSRKPSNGHLETLPLDESALEVLGDDAIHTLDDKSSNGSRTYSSGGLTEGTSVALTDDSFEDLGDGTPATLGEDPFETLGDDDPFEALGDVADMTLSDSPLESEPLIGGKDVGSEASAPDALDPNRLKILDGLLEGVGMAAGEALNKGLPTLQETEFWTRNALYAIKYHVLLSIMYSGGYYRDKLVNELRMLFDRGIRSAAAA